MLMKQQQEFPFGEQWARNTVYDYGDLKELILGLFLHS